MGLPKGVPETLIKSVVKESLGLVGVDDASPGLPVGSVASWVKAQVKAVIRIVEEKEGEDIKHTKKAIVEVLNAAFCEAPFCEGERKLLDGRALGAQTSSFSDSPHYWKAFIIGRLRDVLIARKESKEHVEKILLELWHSFPSIMQGERGYSFVARYFFGGNMGLAYIKVSTLLKKYKGSVKDLDWKGRIPLMVDEFEVLRKEMEDWEGFARKYLGLEGYKKFAEKKAKGNMQTAHQIMSGMSKYLGKDFEDLEWKAQIPLTVKEFEALEKEVKENWEGFARKYKGLKGYKDFAKDWAKGHMQTAYVIMSAMCKHSGKDFKDLEWKAQIPLTVKEFEALEKELKENWEDFVKKYKGLEGYKRFAKIWAKGHMQVAYKFMSAMSKYLGKDFEDLEWKAVIHLTVKEFGELEEKVKENWEGFARKYKGLKGYKDFAKEWSKGNMQAAYEIMSGMSKYLEKDFKALEWEAKIPLMVKEFEALEKEVKENWEGFARKYKGLKGYKYFAKEWSKGHMQAAYAIMSAMSKYLGKDFKDLEWEAVIPLTIKEFEALEKEVKENWEDFVKKYKGLKGYKYFAKEWAKGNMKAAYEIMSAMSKYLGKDFEDLAWGKCLHMSV